MIQSFRDLIFFPFFLKKCLFFFEISVTISKSVFATHKYALVCLQVGFEC